MNLETYETYFQGFFIADCIIRNQEFVYFIAVEDLESKGIDPIAQLPDTKIIMLKRLQDSNEEKWGSVTYDEVKKMKAGVCFTPEERFIGVDAWGQVLVAGGGSSGFEERIKVRERVSITKVRCIANGKAYSVGTRRTVFRRDDINQWVQLTQDNELPLPEEVPMDDSGFKDIDGFSENDLYGCGYSGEIMHYDGKHWTKLNTPTKNTLYAICCAPDGQVYVAGNHGTLLKGRGDHWVQIEQDVCSTSLDNIVWFKDRIYTASWVGLYELVDEQLQSVNPGSGIPPFYYGKGLSARDGILITAGHSSALQFDGESWTVLVGLQSDAELMDNITDMENLSDALDNTLETINELKDSINKSKE